MSPRLNANSDARYDGWAMTRLGMVAVLTLAVGAAVDRLSAQTGASNPIVLVGVSVQNDTHLGKSIDERGRVQLSPLGVLGGIGLKTAVGTNGFAGLTGKVAWFPPIAGQQFGFSEASSAAKRSKSLAIATMTLDWTSRRRANGVSWLVCGGAAWSVQTPRAGTRMAPMGCAGVAGRLGSRVDWRAAIELPARSIGATRFQVPIVLAFHPSP